MLASIHGILSFNFIIFLQLSVLHFLNNACCSGSTIVGIGSPDPPQFIYDDEEYKDVFLSGQSHVVVCCSTTWLRQKLVLLFLQSVEDNYIMLEVHEPYVCTNFLFIYISIWYILIWMWLVSSIYCIIKVLSEFDNYKVVWAYKWKLKRLKIN